MAHSQRTWTGARTPSAIKRVRQSERKRAVNQPRRTAAKTLVSKAMLVATEVAANGSGSPEDVQHAVERAVSALDRAAKIGAIHRNAADRRKSRLMLKVNAALGGEGVAAAPKTARQVSKAQATKQAKARIAASKATKAKGAQTAAGKARAALAKTSRAESTSVAPEAAEAVEAAPAKTTTRRASASTKSAPTAAKGKAAKGKAAATKAPATKARASKTAAKKS